MDKQAGIYRIDVAGTFYYGQSQDLKKREYDHGYQLRADRHPNPQLQAAYNKYEQFSFEAVLVCEISELDRYEQWYLDMYQPMKKCANVATCAEAAARGLRGYKHTDEAKARIAAAGRGRTRTEEAKAKSRAAAKAAWEDPEHRAMRCAKISAALKGKPQPWSRGKKVRPVQVTLTTGEELTFPHVEAAAAQFGVTDVAVARWLRGARKPHDKYGISTIARA